jgi:membrane-associated protein|tara:strand:- start:862 stop:1503 length:642 start_codon:yes stop_codon:yes gene_type:complete
LKYSFVLPLSALVALCLLSVLVTYEFIPSGLDLLHSLQTNFKDYFYLLILFIILLESIVYVGFYFPGQFFAVVLVVLSKPQTQDIFLLTTAMVVAATLGSCINYFLGRNFGNIKKHPSNLSIKSLLVAMIHINSLAFFMFSQGANHKSPKVVLWAGLLNLPYYLLLIWGTSVLSEQVMQMAENTWFLAIAVSIWLGIALVLDYKTFRTDNQSL